jgi:hypothetical protein
MLTSIKKYAIILTYKKKGTTQQSCRVNYIMTATAKVNEFEKSYLTTKKYIANFTEHYQNCSLYIASLSGNIFEIYVEYNCVYAGNQSSCNKVFNYIIKKLQKEKYHIERAGSEYVNIYCF